MMTQRSLRQRRLDHIGGFFHRHELQIVRVGAISSTRQPSRPCSFSAIGLNVVFS